MLSYFLLYSVHISSFEIKINIEILTIEKTNIKAKIENFQSNRACRCEQDINYSFFYFLRK